MGDSRLHDLGLTAIEHALNDEDRNAVETLEQLRELSEAAPDSATA